ncbi:TPA: DUF535 domain-containing protein, partial [Klebsiella pneumoniae]|nr:DUF535 domain-containing protein [Klebsiella pneumoniae]
LTQRHAGDKIALSVKPNYNMAFAYYVNISLLSGSPKATG